ncbi:MAG TPA: response regulator [Cyclobacteriaceae bacterium]
MPLTCLLIDDDIDDREIFALALEDLGLNCSFLTAKNGVDALTLLRSNQSLIPEFIFIDLNMPLLNGKLCLSEIKKIERLHQVPAIIYTTSSHERDIQETRELGALHYLVKPASITTLADYLLKLFKNEPLPFLLKEEIRSLHA